MSASHRPAAAGTSEAALERVDDTFAGRFTAMASPCEILIDTSEHAEAAAALDIARAEALRIEQKFSRYRSDNVVHHLHEARGQPVVVDEETASLLDYAGTCHEMSDGLFDITSGALRRVWTFDGGDRVPAGTAVREALRHVGWQRVTWNRPTIVLPEGMEIDFGGIGKEYAVDRAAGLVAGATSRAFLINFGGDLFASGPRAGARAWAVGVDDPGRPGEAAVYRIDLSRGGLATSGNARRFIRWKGKRLGHILDPRTGWPIEDAPRSVTVLAPTCLEAGTLSTLAYLNGPAAGEFLERQGVRFWIL